MVKSDLPQLCQCELQIPIKSTYPPDFFIKSDFFTENPKLFAEIRDVKVPQNTYMHTLKYWYQVLFHQIEMLFTLKVAEVFKITFLVQIEYNYALIGGEPN